MIDWQPIDTALKENEKPVLLYGLLDGEINGTALGVQACVGAFRYGHWSVDGTDAYSVQVEPTHWAELNLPEDKYAIQTEPSIIGGIINPTCVNANPPHA